MSFRYDVSVMILLLVTCALVICLICMPSGPRASGMICMPSATYQANP